MSRSFANERLFLFSRSDQLFFHLFLFVLPYAERKSSVLDAWFFELLLALIILSKVVENLWKNGKGTWISKCVEWVKHFRVTEVFWENFELLHYRLYLFSDKDLLENNIFEKLVFIRFSGALDKASEQLNAMIDQARYKHHQHRTKFKEAIDYLDQIFEDLKKECEPVSFLISN